MTNILISNQQPIFSDLKPAIDALEQGGIIVYPTDSVYALACDAHNLKGMERICAIRKLSIEKATFTLICASMSDIADYTQHINNSVFRAMKQYFPGPYTFIMNSGKRLPRSMTNRKQTLGVRITADPVASTLLEYYGKPIFSMSLKNEDGEVMTDPVRIAEDLNHKVDVFLNVGEGSTRESTILDTTSGELELIRQGAGEIY